MKFQGDVQLLNGGSLLGARIENLAADPVSPYTGQVWFNTTAGHYKGFTGSAVIQFAEGGALGSYVPLSGATMSGSLVLPTQNTYVADTQAATQGYVDTTLTTYKNTLTGSAESILTATLTKGVALISDASTGDVAVSTTTAAELAAIHNLTPTQGVVTDASGKITTVAVTPTQLAAVGSITGADVLIGNGTGGITSSATTADQLAQLATLTASETLVTDASGNVTTSSTTAAEVGALHLLTASKVAVTNASGLVTTSSVSSAQLAALTSLAHNDVLVSDGSGNVTTSSTTSAEVGALHSLAPDYALVSDTTTGYVKVSGTTTTEIGYVHGVTAPIQTQIDNQVLAAGDTMTGNLVMTTGTKIILPDNATAGTDAVNLNTLQTYTAQLRYRQEAQARDSISTSLPSVAPLSIDGYTVVSGNRVLFTNLSANNNEVYVATVAGSSVTWVASNDLGRLVATPLEGDTIVIENGTIYQEAGYTFNGTSWVQFNGGTQVSPGVGIAKSGNVISVLLGAGVAELPTADVGIDVLPAGGLFLTVDGTTDAHTDANSQLSVLLDGSTLYRSNAGLKVNAQGVTATELATSVFGAGLAGGNGTVASADVYSAGGIINTLDGSTSSSAAAAQLAILLDSTTLAVSATGLKVATGGITPLELNASTIANGLQGAAGTAISVKANTGITVTSSGVGLDLTYADGRYVNVTGDTLTGDLLLNVSSPAYTPAAAASAASAGYVDAQISALDTSLSTLITNLTTRYVNSWFVYESSAPANTHTVTHNIGAQYCNVTVTDSTGAVIIPQSITFTSTSALVVTFNASIDCKVIVSGKATAI